MKLSKFTVPTLVVAIGLCNTTATGQTPMGTAFTYQGQLKQEGGAVTGMFDFQFSLWDAAGSGDPPKGGNQVGSTITLDGIEPNAPSVMVTNGLFAVQLNENGEFGSDAFSGHARWLQIAVRPAGGGGAYTPLSPRQSVTSAPYALHARGTIGVINVRDFGAVGDGVRDDTAAIQDAILAAPPGATVWFPSPDAYYRVSESLIIKKPLTLLGDGAELRLENPEAQCASLIFIQADNVTVRGLKLVGLVGCVNPPVCLGLGDEIGLGIIDARGTGASHRLYGLRIEDNEISGIGYNGIFLRYVNDFQISGNRIENLDFAGVEALSSKFGTIAHNHIRNITGDNTPGSIAYGITLSGCLRDDEPRCTDITVVGNTVEDIPTWEGYDTHGGQRIAFVGNTALRTRVGILVGSLAGSKQSGNLAPLDITVVGNMLDSGVTDGSASSGISFTGASNNLMVQQYATGVISGNVVRGYGNQASHISAAMYIHTTRGLQVVGNTVIEPSPIGINLYLNNDSATVSGNTIIDPWTEELVAGNTTGISVRAQNNTVHIGDNTITCADRVAEHTCEMGVRIANESTNVISLGVNHTHGMMAALVDQTGRASARLAILEAVASTNDFPAATFINRGGSGPGVLIQAGGGGAEYALLDVQNQVGTSHFLVRGDGNVRIGGTGSPNAALETVTSNNTSPAATFINGGGSGPGVLIQAGSGGADYAILDVQTGVGASRFLVRGDGKVGIGTDSPNAALETVTSSNSSTAATFINRGGSGPGVLIQAGSGGTDFAILDVQNQVGTSHFLVRGDGKVGIGRDPLANRLEVEGEASKTMPGHWLQNSDARIKTDVRTIGGALEKLDKVRLVEFRYTDDYRAAHPSIPDRAFVNVIAQEFATVFPEWVRSSGEELPTAGRDRAGDLASVREILQVDPYPLTIYAAAAVQELHRKFTTLEDEWAGRRRAVERLERENAELRARLARLEELLAIPSSGK